MVQSTDDREQSLALETAWQRYAQLESNAHRALKYYLTLRGWGITLAVVATLLAVVTACADSAIATTPLSHALRASLILIPIIGLVILVFANKQQQGQYWQILATGAAELQKEIYFYRTLLQGQANRHHWLNERVTAIQRQVSESLGSNFVLQSYTGTLPPDYPDGEPNHDSGFSDLLADDYLRDRLEAQFQWYSQKITSLHATNTSLKIGIFALGILSGFLPTLGSNFNSWVAFTTSLGTSVIAWIEISRLDVVLSHYNQLTLDLNIIRDYWQSLNPEERTGDEFFKLVIATEKVLWSQHNQPNTQMRQAVTELQQKTSDLLAHILTHSAPAALNKALLSKKHADSHPAPETAEVVVEKIAEKIIAPTPQEELKPSAKKGLPHAFVVMPFGRKQGPDGRLIDFNAIYQDLIKPALEEAGFEPFRADEEAVSGDILTDMFQELLLADLVLADLSIDNANVFYELGVRHALRKRGLIHIQCGRAYLPYDIFNVRALPYQCDENGRPDPQSLHKDKQAIVKMARATWESDQNRIHSPIFTLLDGLGEPDRKALQTPLAMGYWQEYREWQERVTIAKRQKRIGDVLLLTEEVSNRLIQEDAIAEAGQALTDLGNHALALKEYREGLKINPLNSEFRRQEAFHLSRLKQSDEAIVKLEWLLQDEPTNIEAICNLARIYKEMWSDEWKDIANPQEQLQAAYEAVHLLRKSIETYLNAYRLNQNHCYSGINALTFLAVLEHLTQQVGTDDDPEEQALKQQLPALKGAMQFCLESTAQKSSNDFWVYASFGDLAICVAQEPRQVERAYKKACTLPGKSKFALQTILTQLELLEQLNFRPDYVRAGIRVLKTEYERFEHQEKAVKVHIDHEPAQVFLFAGHMIDQPSRLQPRFPEAMESEARQKIDEVLDKLHPTPNCLAIAPGIACGGDILFIEACLRRDMRVDVFLPFEQAEFIKESVSFAGDSWVSRFYKIHNHPNITIHLQPNRLGPVPDGDNPFERNNRWALYSTLMYGIDRVRLVVLWDGKGGDAPGGTGHMVQEVRRLGGIVEHIDTTKFDYWQTKKNVMEPIFHKLLDNLDNSSALA
ncbi:MAG TPA: tetratricopeptide repeat-containing protein [Coleofasciculaceae cyanobacterium]